MLSEKIADDLKTALKARDGLVTSTLRMLRAAMKNKEIEKKHAQLTDEDILDLVQKQVKSRKESVDQFTKGGRDDLAKKEQAEIDILMAYLPKPMSGEELEAVVKGIIAETGAVSKADLGKVIKACMAKHRGRIDGQQVNQAAARLLG
jgi:uncharacterized protein